MTNRLLLLHRWLLYIYIYCGASTATCCWYCCNFWMISFKKFSIAHQRNCGSVSQTKTKTTTSNYSRANVQQLNLIWRRSALSVMQQVATDSKANNKQQHWVLLNLKAIKSAKSHACVFICTYVCVYVRLISTNARWIDQTFACLINDSDAWTIKRLDHREG